MQDLPRTVSNIFMLLLIFQESADRSLKGMLIVVECVSLVFYFISTQCFESHKRLSTERLLRAITAMLLLYQGYLLGASLFCMTRHGALAAKSLLNILNSNTQMLVQAFAHMEGYEYARYSSRGAILRMTSLLIILHHSNTYSAADPSENTLAIIMSTRACKMLFLLYFVLSTARHIFRKYGFL